jgi:predicted Zn-dependent protease
MIPKSLRILVTVAGVFLLVGFKIPSLPVPSEVGKALEVGTKTGQKAIVAARGISDSEEYYIGRAVAARLLSRSSLSQNQDATMYVNEVGQAVARKSTQPTTYRGYHFGILETSDPNAYACPGGIILITRGLLKECQNEDELAAVLAHEVAHIAHKDGVNSINKARWTEVLTTAGTEATRQYAGGVAGQLVTLFERSIDDVFKTLVVNGYSRKAEESADRAAISTLSRAGYNPAALAAILGRLQSKGGGGGFFRSHPLTSQRVEAVKMLVTATPGGPSEKVRTERFKKVNF